MTDGRTDYQHQLEGAVEGFVARQEAELKQWREHSAKWESIARNVSQVLAQYPEHQDVFRRQCEIEGVTP